MRSKDSVSYQIRNSTLSLMYGDITALESEVIVSSDDNLLSMGGGVSRAILAAAGHEYYQNTRNIPLLQVGDVFVSDAGRLKAKHVFHIITIDYIQPISGRNHTIPFTLLMRKAVLNALQLCEQYGVQSIAFPALATGVAGVPFQDIAIAMIGAIAEHLVSREEPLRVTVTLYARNGVDPSQLDVFYDKTVAISVQFYISQSLTTQLSTLQDKPAHHSKHYAHESLDSYIRSAESALFPSDASSEATELLFPMVSTDNTDALLHELPPAHRLATEITLAQMQLNALYAQSRFSLFEESNETATKIHALEEHLRQLRARETD
jgi:O-acetyl-ADP-ribose deacetylase (regulator of RNase III)